MSLLSRAQSHDPTAWSTFVSLYTPLVYHWARKRGLTPEASQQVGQDVFLHVYQRIQSFQPTDSTETIHCWLARLTHKKIMDNLEQQQRGQNQGDDQRTAESETPEDSELVLPRTVHEVDAVVVQNETKQLYHSAMMFFKESLSESEWKIFSRIELDHQPIDAVASELHRNCVEVISIKSRLLRKFRHEYAGLFRLD
ncbi:sigma-70 family RNA polymerase sigma factor [Thalassoglobus polymorphus]|uniref:sigma-70 family RNA polymerase sigma factor n=1 Tax=Thalassoglobus polymorphus TaxID=2527994 RepID=UPI0018D2365F|nr:sigma-70 family RNA polymerase sigma factor [Thalassoglobus polymorphus]